MMEGVGRRLGSRTGHLLNIGTHSLNGRERNVLFRNDLPAVQSGDPAPTFTEVAWVTGADRIEDGRGVAVFDADRDGQLDIALRNYRMPAGVLISGGGDAHWVDIALEGTRSNRDAIGARIRVRSGNRWQSREVAAGSGYLSGSSLIQHFGLADRTQVDEVLIDWPSGEQTRLVDLDADKLHTIREGTPTTALHRP
jgi:hypothetical protein